MNKDTIAARVKKLLAVTESAGATPAEAAVALEKARMIMAEHMISESDLKSSSEKVFFSTHRIRDKEWYNILALSVCELYGGRIVVIREEIDRYPYGRIAALDSALDTIEITLDKLERMINRLSYKLPAEYRNEFRLGFSKGIFYQIAAIIQKPKSSSDSTALVVIDQARSKIDSVLIGDDESATFKTTEVVLAHDNSIEYAATRLGYAVPIQETVSA